ncbi:metal-dependent hydrolase family protein [Pedobacter sp. PACM 27299]|uniref:metal-dependent hydrolase family protein n=1 Tax=Pedobacter sp. PACM 27299 TaxID=1727164 RepID=UPI0009E7240E|nr:amidohydrolase family protein [Pedobacter sp. PACM 27299]
MKYVFTIILLTMASMALGQPRAILINNVEIFNGKDEKTIIGNVLIEANLIKTVSTSPIAIIQSTNTQIIDGKGKFLMPGLIDAHIHLTMESIPLQLAMISDIGYVNLVAADAAKKQLFRGFTTGRDMGGASFSLMKAIDQGIINGPRIYPSGATISQTGGHGDFGMPTDVPKHTGAPLNYMEKSGMTIIADGADQVLMRAREQLRLGATQIKVMAGGGVASSYDPLDVSQFTEAEIKAAVDAADNWGTYVAVHAYTPKAIVAAVHAGVKCIEHAQLMDDATAKLLAQKGVWLSLQPFLDDADANPQPEGSENRKKQLEMTKGTDNAYALAKKYNIKTAWGTDCLFDAKLATRQGAQLAKLVRWYKPFEILRMATSTNAELLALCGKRNPYSEGKLGVIEQGAYADLLLVDGNPIKNIKLIENPEKNFIIIMKNGIIYKNMVSNKD